MFQTLTFIEGCAGDSGGPLVLNTRDVSANQDGDFIVAIFTGDKSIAKGACGNDPGNRRPKPVVTKLTNKDIFEFINGT